MTFFRTATEVAAEIRRGTLSSRELTEGLFARIDASDVNAVVATRREFALAAASKADATTGGPLHGVPMTIKDAFAVAGMATTWGEPAFAHAVAGEDAEVVRRLRDAGAIVVGKSNVHRMLADFGQTANPVYGRTLNPRDRTRTPGGSSGGAAAALAAGLSFVEYGSDLAGSIRIPAAYCGVYGLKPTPGTVSLRGFQPPGPATPLSREFPSAVGPLARSAADLRLALSVTGGAMKRSRRSKVTGFRVGVVLDDPACPVTSDVGKAFSDAVDALASAGLDVREGGPDDVDPVAQVEAFGFQVEWFLAAQAPARADEEEQRRLALTAAWARYFTEVDVFLCPTVFTTAPRHDDRDRYEDQVFWIAQASLPGLPAVSAPLGDAGLQVVGPAREDDTAITFAELAADVVGGFVAPAE
ncbi:amidase family protein [Amycolatopsis stemonae]